MLGNIYKRNSMDNMIRIYKAALKDGCRMIVKKRKMSKTSLILYYDIYAESPDKRHIPRVARLSGTEDYVWRTT